MPSSLVIAFGCFVLGSVLTFAGPRFSREIARMSGNAILALLWLVFATGLIAGFAFFLGWLDDRAERRKAHHAAE
jgi:TRAP-type mannitol/chloroaromatic compound transport system permease small subunit